MLLVFPVSIDALSDTETNTIYVDDNNNEGPLDGFEHQFGHKI